MLRDYSIGDRARGRWKEILPVLGVDARLLTGKHVPCPICGGTDRFRFDDKEGRGTYFCNQCRAGDGITLLQRLKGWDFLETVGAIEKIIGEIGSPAPEVPSQSAEETAAEKFKQAQAYWRSGERIAADDPVDRYLRRRIGSYAPTRALKTIAASPFGGRTFPAMISAYVDVHGDLAGIQRTFLTADGRKAELDASRWNTGALPDGGAVRLAMPSGAALGIAEGVETALSATAMFGLPVWAALNDNRLAVWQPPEGITDIVIFGDADPKYAGQAAAYALAKRLAIAKLTVQVMIPPDLGTDWNDVLMARRADEAVGKAEMEFR